MILLEFWRFLRERKKYWIMPIVLILVLLSFLVLFSQTAVVPFVYTLF